MSNAPHLLPKSREGFKYGDVTLRDHMAYDGLHDVFTDQADGQPDRGSERRRRVRISREEQDAFAAASHQRAAKAWKDGIFDGEVVPVSVPQRRGEPVVVDTDEGMRADTTVESLCQAAPAFSKDGTVTAGSASQISDGAAAVVVMSKAKAQELGLSWIAEIGAARRCRRSGLDAAVPARAGDREGLRASRRRTEGTRSGRDQRGVRRRRDRVARELGLDSAKVNVNGGAISLGHPLGVSGARIALHLALELQRRGGGVGAAALCGGGGQGDALILRVPEN